MKRIAALLIIGAMVLPGLRTSAQGPTNTPTPTATPTLTNEQRMSIATIVPPAQCGTVFTPCGLMPWPYIQFPTLAAPSPTLINPERVYASIPSVTPAVTNTPGTPTATTAPDLDLGPVNTLVGNFNDVQSTMLAQSTVVIEVSGTPQGITDLGNQISTGVPGVFGTIKGVAAATHSTTFSVIGFALLVLLFALLVYFTTLFLPIILIVVRLILQVIQAFKPF